MRVKLGLMWALNALAPESISPQKIVQLQILYFLIHQPLLSLWSHRLNPAVIIIFKIAMLLRDLQYKRQRCKSEGGTAAGRITEGHFHRINLYSCIVENYCINVRLHGHAINSCNLAPKSLINYHECGRTVVNFRKSTLI